MLSVPVKRYADLHPLAKMIDSWGNYGDLKLYDVDLRMDQRYLLKKRLFPMGLTDIGKLRAEDSYLRLDYPIPPLKNMELEVSTGGGIPTMDDRLISVKAGGVILDGPEDRILEDLGPLISGLDPDVIYTDQGDSFVMPYLQARSKLAGISLELGREKGQRIVRGKSYFTYGRIIYKPPAHKLRGRAHIDRDSCFIFKESGIYGLIELSRLSLIPLQDLARLSPGSAISAMEVNEAIRSGHVILWKKNRPEDFKTARELITSDRGGFIYEPKVGVHDHVSEVDFFSLYPSIMLRFNISPETLMCQCCPASEQLVPGIGTISVRSISALSRVSLDRCFAGVDYTKS